VAELPEDVLLQDLDRLRTAELVYQTEVTPEAVFIFKHALVQEVAYSRLSPGRQRELHARAVAALEARDRSADTVEWLGHHALRGGLWAKAATYLQDSGARAAARAANREAVAAFEHALEALAHLPKTRESAQTGIDLRLQLKNALTHIGVYERLLAPLQEAEQLAREIADPVRLGRVHAFTCDAYRLTGDLEQAIEEGRRSLSLAEQHGDDNLSVMAHTYLGMALHVRGAYHEATALFRRNVELLSGERVTMRGDMAGYPSVHSRVWLIRCLAETGAFDEAVALGLDAVAIAERSEHPLNLAMAAAGLGRAHTRRGALESAVTILERSLDTCRRWDLALWMPAIAEDLGLAYVWSDRTDDAVKLLEWALERGVRLRAGHAVRLAYLGEGYLRAGREQEARSAASTALDVARTYGQRGYEVWALRLHAEIAAQFESREAERTLALYQQAISLAGNLGMGPLVARCLLGLSRVQERRGDGTGSAASIKQATAMMHAMGMDQTWMSLDQPWERRP
jgi:tetratricopeptide (TPR) repeat protein